MTSILKVSEIQDPTNSNTALTIDSAGVVTGKVNESRQIVMGFTLTSGVSGDANPITGWANMATQLSGDGAGEITTGGSVSESSGTFSFPTTGLWKIEFNASLQGGSGDTTVQYNMDTTQDNSSYSSLIQVKESTYTSSAKAHTTMVGLLKVTDTTNDKVRFRQLSFGGHTTEGSTSEALTYVFFTWLGVAS